MLHSTYHWFPLLNGQSGHEPVSYRLTTSVAQALPARRALDLLGRMTGLRYVLVHTRELHARAIERWHAPDGMRLVARQGGDWLFEVEDPPPVDLRERLLDSSVPTHTVPGTPLEPVPPEGRRAVVEIGDTADRSLPRWFYVVTARVTNLSGRTWPSVSSDASRRVALRCRWLDADGGSHPSAAPDGAPLPFDLRPGESVDVEFQCATPAAEGRYLLDVGVVQASTWFDSDGDRVAVEVRRPRRPRP
jgi:hypothetical protein